MSIKRYLMKGEHAEDKWGIIYVEDHTHLMRSPTWKVFNPGHHNIDIVIGLCDKPWEIAVQKNQIKKPEQFVGKYILTSISGDPEAKNKGCTGPIIDIEQLPSE